MARDASRDGFGNELQTYVLTHFGRLWRLLQRSRPRRINKALIDSAIYNPLLAPSIFKEDTFSAAGWEIVNAPVTLSDLVNRSTRPAGKAWKVTFNRDRNAAGAPA